MPLLRMIRTLPSWPALAMMEMVGEVGVVATSFIVPNRLALVAPVAVICTLAENVFTCCACCAASVST